MSRTDTITDETITSMEAKNAMLMRLAELYNAMVEVAMEKPFMQSAEFVKAEAKRRMALGIVKHSYLEGLHDLECEPLDG